MIKDSDKRHLQLLMEILLDAIERKETITYGNVYQCALARNKELGKRMTPRSGLPKLLGNLNDAIANLKRADKKLPPISAIVVRQSDRLPGGGIRNFPGFKDWDKLAVEEKRERSAKVQQRIFSNKTTWKTIYKSFFKKTPKISDKRDYRERDGNTLQGIRGAGGESREHKNLKNYVAKNPHELKITEDVSAETEFPLLSGDRVDVAFVRKAGIVLVEVKSRISSNDDLERGIYQCVKYRAVYCAWRRALLDVSQYKAREFARAVLVTERDLPKELDVLAKMLKVKHYTIKRRA